mgnify:CR=1 FL=1
MSAPRPFLGLVRPLVGVVHLPPLPGAPGHAGMDAVRRRAVADARALAAAGVDALVVENFGDAPFWKDDVPPATVAGLTAAALAVAEAAPRLTLGVNCLRNDARAALAVAAAVGAAFVRVNVLTGAMLTDQGVVEGRAAEIVRLRDALAPSVRIVADVLVKHAVPLAPQDVVEVARDTAERGGADALLVTGTRSARAPDDGRVRAVRAAVPRTPVLLGSGVTTANVAALLPHADGALVGSAFERGGRTGAPVDARRARAFVAAWRRARDAS